jgi:hypothetical protein
MKSKVLQLKARGKFQDNVRKLNVEQTVPIEVDMMVHFCTCLLSLFLLCGSGYYNVDITTKDNFDCHNRLSM